MFTQWLINTDLRKTFFIIFHFAKSKTTGNDVVMQNSALSCATTPSLRVIRVTNLKD